MNLPKKKVADNIQDTQWSIIYLAFTLEIKHKTDFLILDKSVNGNFSSNLTEDKGPFMQNVWNNSIPFKIYINFYYGDFSRNNLTATW